MPNGAASVASAFAKAVVAARRVVGTANPGSGRSSRAEVTNTNVPRPRAGIAGQIVWATISDRFLTAHTVMAAIGFLMTAAALLTAALGPDWPVLSVIAVAAIYGVSASGFVPVLLGELIRAAPPGQAGALG
jgi:pimeloyl-ACP methyl ester carboxylesterase